MANKTQLIIFHRPNSGRLVQAQTSDPTSYFRQAANPNQPITPDYIDITRPSAASGQGSRVDLYDNIDIPITYTIMDIREPDKRKTSWSKTIKVPGTKNNNRLFGQIYNISGDGWTTIGNVSVYQGFNPNLRTEIIVLNDGVQVLKGNLQLKGGTMDKDGNVEYEVQLYGDLTSIFGDIGSSKLNDLDFSEWDHTWSKQNIYESWYGLVRRNGATFSNVVDGPHLMVSRLESQLNTKRMMVTTTTAHGFSVGDFVVSQYYFSSTSYGFYGTSNGTWCVAEVISATQFTLNTPLPLSVLSSPSYPTVPSAVGYVYKRSSIGKGYVYPLVSWGDEYDFNSFPVTSMAPAYYIKEIWDKIFSETNSKYSSTFLESEMFKRLILVQKKQAYELTGAEVKSRQFLVGSLNTYDSQVSYHNKETKYFNFGTTVSYATASYGATGSYPVNAATDGNARMKFSIETPILGATALFFDGTGSVASPNNNWDNSTHKWTVKKSGEYDVNLSFNLDSWIDITGMSTGPADGTASIQYDGNQFQLNIISNIGPLGYGAKMRVYVDIFRKRGGVTKSIYQTYTDFDAYPPVGNYNWSPTSPHWSSNKMRLQPASWRNKNISINYKGAYYATNDEVFVVVSHYAQGLPGTFPGSLVLLQQRVYAGDGDWYVDDVEAKWLLRVKGMGSVSPAVFGNIPSPKSGENSVIYGREFLPKDMTCKDFLKNIIKMFNLHIEPDREVERLYYIEPRDDYYYTGASGSGDYVDWSDKLDKDSVTFDPMGELTSKYYTFTNKAETDYWNKRFKEERGRDYMTYQKEIDNDFLKNETKIDVTFGSTVMINNPEGSDVVMPAVLQKESNGSFKPVSNSAARVLFWTGTRPYSGGKGLGFWNLSNPVLGPGFYGWELISDANIAPVAASSSGGYYQYPYAGTVDSPQDPMYDINWFNMEDGDFVYWDAARWSDHNLYNVYWKNFIDEISDPTSKVIKAKFQLSPKDIYNLDFRKIYVVDRNYFRLQKVMDYNAMGDNLTTVEFLKLKQLTKYRRTSLGYNETFEYMVSTTRPIFTSTAVIGPRTKSARDGSFNNVMPGNMGMGTIDVKGLGNVIGDVRGSSVVGNENHIGSGAINVNIKGDGVFVSGGAKNVNVIGTNKISINESDVTYINGVRYKHGVPVSKSNVIDGGQTSATSSLVSRSSMNMTTNIVDSGEDVVINIGSIGHEDMVDAGSNCILSDVPELGLSTQTTPNPRTNLSRGYILGTASQVDAIRAVRFDQNTN